MHFQNYSQGKKNSEFFYSNFQKLALKLQKSVIFVLFDQVCARTACKYVRPPDAGQSAGTSRVSMLAAWL